jgi:hypothetical protein
MKGKSFHQKIKYKALIYGKATCNNKISNSRMIHLRRIPQMGTLCSELRYIEYRKNIRVTNKNKNQISKLFCPRNVGAGHRLIMACFLGLHLILILQKK